MVCSGTLDMRIDILRVRWRSERSPYRSRVQREGGDGTSLGHLDHRGGLGCHPSARIQHCPDPGEHAVPSFRHHLTNKLIFQVGYYHLSGVEPAVLKDTDFEAYKHVFSGAWLRILHAIGNAERYGLGVLIGKYSQ